MKRAAQKFALAGLRRARYTERKRHMEGSFMLTEQLFDFLAASPSCYHAVQALAERLERNGYAQLREQDAWALTPGGKYFVTRNGSSLLSFRIPQSAPALSSSTSVTADPRPGTNAW